MKVLTFVIPAYNSEQFLDKCILSMLVPELFSKLEIIVVNDGSTDGTGAVAKSFCDKYPDVVCLISQENKGHGGALNTGCAAARGKYLKVIDADDWVDTQNLPAFVELLEKCSSDVVLTHHHTIDIGTGEIKNWRSYPQEFGRSYTIGEIMSDWCGFEQSMTFHGITYRTSFYKECCIRLSEHVFYEDHEFATYPCCYAKSVTPFDLFLYEYRVGDINQSVSTANQLKRIGHTETVIRRMTEEYRKLTEAPEQHYAERKIQSLLLRYLNTVLLAHADRKTGRQLAAERVAECQINAPAVYELVRWRYRIFCLLNRIHISKQSWEKLQNSKVYNLLRKSPPA